jgi:hypothetical protein
VLFGRKNDTVTSGTVRFQAGDRWGGIEWQASEAGDGTVPERSAVHAHAREILPFPVSHGDIYVNASVLEFLQWNLVDKYRLATRASRVTLRYRISFSPERDIYRPGEIISLWAVVEKHGDDASPVSGVSVRVQLRWKAVLPGADEVAVPSAMPTVALHPGGLPPGRLEGGLRAPVHEGYYQLHAIVRVPGEGSVSLDELIAVEAEGDQAGS